MSAGQAPAAARERLVRAKQEAPLRNRETHKAVENSRSLATVEIIRRYASLEIFGGSKMTGKATGKVTGKVTYYTWIESPLGPLLLVGDGHKLIGLYLKGQKHFPTPTDSWQASAQAIPFVQTQTQLSEYFAHQRQRFDLPTCAQGTDFQKQVWQLLPQIPFGKTVAYGSLAEKIGQPGAARAIGSANGRNPLSIIVPCHRVIAANGQLTGYAGGVDRKQWLLAHEQKALIGQQI